MRHWFTMRAKQAGSTGVRTPRCLRCGAANPTILTTDDWTTLYERGWKGLTEAERKMIEDAIENGWPGNPVGGEVV